MDIKTIKNALSEVLSSDETKELLREKVEKIADKKAKLLFDQEKENQKKVTENEIKKIKNIISKYVNETVNEFLSEHKKDFETIKNKSKVNCILESLTATLKLAGINAESIVNGTKYKLNEDAEILKERIETLKSQLQEEQMRVKKIKMSVKSEINEMENSFNNKISELKSHHNEELNTLNENLSSKSIDEIQRLNSELEQSKSLNEDLNDKVAILENKIQKLIAENSKMLQMGIISEFTKDMSLTESQKFENCAKNIPFSNDKSYVKHLETLKESIKGADSLIEEEVVNNSDDIPEAMKRFI